MNFEPQIQFSGERRQVTALFYDIVESTELLLRSDPEEFLRSVARLHETAERIIRRYRGFVHQKHGDGGSCYFGYPQQSEDAAQNAVQAALELIDVVERRQHRSHKTPFRLRVGVATSLIVVSSDGGEVIGTAPVLASRLQAEAQPNSVLVADSTYELTRSRFVYSFLKEAKLKGFSTPIGVWRPISATKPRGRFSRDPKPDTPIRGREKELARLMSEWSAVCGGAGRSIAIVGDAGIGKSRLVAEFCRRIQHGPDVDVFLQCNRGLSGQPLHPVLGFLETKIGKPALESGDSRRLQEALRVAGFDVEAETARVISDFAAEKSRSTLGNIRVGDLSGQALRREIIGAAIRIVCAAASAPAILIVVEDIHWADNMTREVLDSLNEYIRDLPVMVLQTSRAEVSTKVDEKLILTGLRSSAMSDLVRSIWQGAPPPGLSAFILQQCDGMPLYGEELALFFRTRHPTAQTPTGWTKLLIEGGVSTLNDLLASKLAEVAHARRTAQLASVIGREFSADLLRRLMDQVDGEALDADLAALVAYGVLDQKAGSDDMYQFHHVLLQEAAYGSLLRKDRRRIHERIARILVEEDVPSLTAAVAAWQCAEAGRHGDAARFALKAAEACVLRSAMHEAAQSLELCAQEIAAMPRQQARTELRLDFLQLQGVVSTALEGEGSLQARNAYSRAMSLVRRHPPTNRQERFPLYWGWWFTAPNIVTQQSRAQVLVEDMKAVDDPETRLQSYHCAWATSFHAAQHSFCLDCVVKGIELYDSERAIRNRAFFGGHDAKVCGLGESALSYLLTGQADASETAINQCLEWAALTDHAGSMVHALYYAIVLRRCQSRYDDVYRLGEQMLSLAEQNGLLASQARANMYCGWAELMSASPERGAKRFQDGLSLHRQIGTDDNLSIHSDMYSEVLARIGKPAESVALIDSAIANGRKSGQWFWLAELYRRRASLRQMLGEKPGLIKRDLRRAIQTAEAQGAEWLAERARRDLNRDFDGGGHVGAAFG